MIAAGAAFSTQRPDAGMAAGARRYLMEGTKLLRQGNGDQGSLPPFAIQSHGCGTRNAP
ncbi:hypothetical protein H845_1534 [Komagataeibacter xylinus E25]|nr:hypothetical protein H845_1534 [Komagataeibacter xylinus E25]